MPTSAPPPPLSPPPSPPSTPHGALTHWCSHHWADVVSSDFAAARQSGLAARTLAVLPVAAIEQHGPHLPLSVDATLLAGVIEAALPLLGAADPVLLLPAQTIGLSTEHLAYPGTLSLRPATLLALWTEIGEAVARAGIGRLLLLNGHGGNIAPMDIAARELRQRCGLLTYSSSWFNLPLPESVSRLFDAAEHRFGIHGGALETSMMLHLAPEQVRMSEARDWRSSAQDRAARFAILGNGKSAKMGWAMQDYHPSGAVGNAAAASAEKGRAVTQAAAAALADLWRELLALPIETLVSQESLMAGPGDEFQ